MNPGNSEFTNVLPTGEDIVKQAGTHMGASEFTHAFFDDSSTAWRANKIRKPNATYSYKCRSVLKSGKPCTLSATTLEQTCKRHSKTLVSKLEPGSSLGHFKDIPPLEKDPHLTLAKA